MPTERPARATRCIPDLSAAARPQVRPISPGQALAGTSALLPRTVAIDRWKPRTVTRVGSSEAGTVVRRQAQRDPEHEVDATRVTAVERSELGRCVLGVQAHQREVVGAGAGEDVER